MRPIVHGIVVFLVGIALAAVVIYNVEQRRLHHAHEVARVLAADHAQALQQNLQQALSAARALASWVRLGGGDIAAFDALVTDMLKRYPGTSALALEPDGVVARIVPLQGNANAIGLNLLRHPQRQKEAQLARDTGQLTLAGPFELVQGGLGALGFYPVFLDDANGHKQFWGFTNVVMRLPQALGPGQFEQLLHEGYDYALWRMDPSTGQRQVIAQAGQLDSDSVSFKLDVPNAQWTLSVAPTGGWGDTRQWGLYAALALLLSGLAARLTWQVSTTDARAAALQRQLNGTSHEFQATLDALPDLLFVMGADGRYLEVHATQSQLLVAPVGGLLGRTVSEVLPAEAALTIMVALQEASELGSSHDKWIELNLPDGQHWFELSVSRLGPREGGPERFVVLSRDITRRKQAEQKLARLTKLYAALSQCNQAIVRCHDEVELFDILCRDAVNFGGMKMAWIGKVDSVQKRLVPVAWYGDGTDFLPGFSVSLDGHEPAGSGPASIALREDRPYWCQDIHHDATTEFLHERASRYGWGSAAALPLHLKGEVTGLLSVYSDVPDAFDAAVQSLLQEMVMDISFALDRFADEREQQRVQEALRDSEERYHKAFRTSPDSVNINRLVDGQYLDVNVGFEQLTGWSRDEVVGKTSAEINIWRDMADRQRLVDALRSEGRCLNLEADFVARDGHIVRGLMSATVVHFNGMDCILNITRDITQMRRAEAQIEHLAHFDQLTGLPNRSLVRDHFDLMRSLAERSGECMALMFLDLDHFKSINDTLGHSVGDQLLVQVSQRLRETLRAQDTLARMGGDEFIVLLSSVQADEAAQVAGKIISTLEASCQVEHLELVSTASIGIAMYPEDGEDFETLSKNADTAMYRVKQGSRNGFCFFTQEMQRQSERALNLVNAMRHALDRQEFELHYQPQVSLQDGRVIGAEALLRWHSAELGPLMPGEFIPVAEDSGLILEIGEWVLRTAVAQAKQWQQAGLPPLVVAVNLSAVQFRHPNLFGLVTRILDQAQLPAHYLEIELTEATAMDDPVAAVALMNKLHERGVRMSIDDFGTGYSSLSYLKKFKVYKLKIDQSFVRDISDDPDDKAIVTAIINLASSLGMHTIAEGVETASQLAFLRLQGCDEVQGYYFSKPLPAQQFEAFLHDQPGVKCDPSV